jgi:hypothetical protein
MAVGYRLLGSPANAAMLLGLNYANANVAPYTVLTLQYNSTLQPRSQYSTAGPGFATVGGSSATNSIGVDYVMSVTANVSSGATLYQNGGQISAFATLPVPVYTSNSNISVGYNYSVGGRTADALIYWAAWWNTALPASVHAQIGSNVNAIWQVMQPQRGLKYFYSATIKSRRTLTDRVGSRGVA